jgi:hypothetical protein
MPMHTSEDTIHVAVEPCNIEQLKQIARIAVSPEAVICLLSAEAQQSFNNSQQSAINARHAGQKLLDIDRTLYAL